MPPHMPIRSAKCLTSRARTLMPTGLCALVLVLNACSRPPETTGPLQGYVEGEFALVAAPSAGTLAKLKVRRGQEIDAGTELFQLERTNEEAAAREASERLRSSEQRLANLRIGKRPAELEVIAAQSAQAAASRKLSVAQLQQQEKLFAGGFISQAALDQAHANYERDMAKLSESDAQGRVARLPLGRDAEIRAAEAEVATARAALAQNEWRLNQRGASAPAKALVQDTYFVEGEWVPPGRPVVSLLPHGNVKVRVFVPEQRLGAIKQGDRVSITCDGCGAAVPATITFISALAEFTPPVIFSKESRAKLVYMVEARSTPEDARKLRPGQPVDVVFHPAASTATAAP